MNYRMMGRFIAQILLLEGLFMLPAMFISLAYRESTAAKAFVLTIVLLLVMYQPVYHRDTGRFDSAEALIRLSDDQDQPISPAEFIPVAGENGLIDALS